MALFSTKKSKARKAEKAGKKAEQEKLAVASTKSTPTHTAAEMQTNGAGDRENNREQIAPTNHILGNPAAKQTVAQSAIHGRSMSLKTSRDPATLNTQRRANSAYSRPAQQQAPSFDSPILGNPKMQAAARDRGYISPHCSTDSGYGSTGPSSTAHSRAPSTNRSPHEQNHLPLLRQPTNFLPELTLAQELAREPAFSERSLTLEDQQETPRAKHFGDSQGINEEAFLEQTESGTDKASEKSSRSNTSRKQTRFEEAAEPVPPIPKQQDAQGWTQAGVTASTNRQERPAQHQQYNPPAPSVSAISTERAQDLDLARTTRAVSPVAARQYEAMSPYSQGEPGGPYERGRQSQQYSAHETQSAAPVSRGSLSSTNQMDHARQRSASIPPLSILDGLKVNKRGRILDEEGDPIGELFEGDIIDCVRQKANASGEVLDEYGGIVGRVRTLPRETQSHHRSSVSSRPGEQDYFQQNFQLPSHIDFAQPYSRRPSLQHPAPVQHQEQLRQIASLPFQEPVPIGTATHFTNRRPSVAPLDLPTSEGALELDASQPVEYEPVFDYSEPFMPQPHVPAKLHRRPETPSPARAGVEMTPSETGSSASERYGDARSTQPQSTDVVRPATATEQYSTPAEQRRSSAAAARSPTEAVGDGDVTPKATPAQLVANLQDQSAGQPEKQTQTHTTPSRPLARSVSERTPSFARASVPGVPEDLPKGRSPTLFSYKGDIPSSDGPPPNAGRVSIARVKSPALPSFPRQAFAAGAAGGSPFSGTGMGGAPPMPSRRISGNGGPLSGAPGMGMQRPGMKSRFSTNTPLVRSPLSSHETTPPESDEGSENADRDQVGALDYAKFRAHSRATSIRTVSSISSTGKPRTYFTHAGRVTVDAGELPPSTIAAQTAAKNTSNVVVGEKKDKDTKKKSRMSLFGKKK